MITCYLCVSLRSLGVRNDLAAYEPIGTTRTHFISKFHEKNLSILNTRHHDLNYKKHILSQAGWVGAGRARRGGRGSPFLRLHIPWDLKLDIFGCRSICESCQNIRNQIPVNMFHHVPTSWKRVKTYACPLPRKNVIFLFAIEYSAKAQFPQHPHPRPPRASLCWLLNGKQKNSTYSWQGTGMFLDICFTKCEYIYYVHGLHPYNLKFLLRTPPLPLPFEAYCRPLPPCKSIARP